MARAEDLLGLKKTSRRGQSQTKQESHQDGQGMGDVRNRSQVCVKLLWSDSQAFLAHTVPLSLYMKPEPVLPVSPFLLISFPGLTAGHQSLS